MLLETEHLKNYAGSIEAQSDYEIPVRDEANNNNHNNNNNEIRNNLDDNGFNITRGTPIQDFYDGQSIFITGGTGFLGKILTEKLLRSCPNISTIYLLIRNKKDKNVEDRIEEQFSNQIYDRLREVSPKFRHKIVGIPGDCSLPGLGISSTDRERLTREVSIVFHSAATVRFNEKLNVAVAINVGSTIEIIDLCRSMTKLKAFIHVSTAYANCPMPKIEERFYDHTIAYEALHKLLQGLDDQEIKKMTPKILGKWPNTYSFTKAMAEVVIRERSKGLNVGLFRPAIVISTASEPVPGWTDNFYGPTGAVTAVASGVLRTLRLSPHSTANVVPVDFTVNALIASAWDVANQTERRDEKMLIYNYVSTVDYSISWEQYVRINMIYAKQYPLNSAQWAVTVYINNSKTMDTLSRILFHYTPAVFADLFTICIGKRPKTVQSYKKLHQYVDMITWFCTNDWSFTDDNVVDMWRRLDIKDQKIFRFSIKDMDWNRFFHNYVKGIRVYLLKDDLKTLEAAKKRATRFNWIHQILKAMVFTFSFWVLWKIVCAVFF